MVFALHKNRHYLLKNKFVFYVDHLALIYLVNKPQILGRITWWLLFFLEYDFTLVYKLGGTHVLIDSLSRLLAITEPTSLFDQTTYVSLFYVELKWLKDVKELSRTWHIEGTLLV